MRTGRLLPVIFLGCLLLTFLNGLVVGYGALWLQIDARVDRQDYFVSFGGYAAAAMVLLAGLLPLLSLDTARWAVPVVATMTALLALLAVHSIVSGIRMEYELDPLQHWWDGAGGVLLLPWTWPPLILAVLDVLRGDQDHPGAR